MFIRDLKSRNGKIYVQVVYKSSGSYRVLKSFGSCVESDTIGLRHKAQEWINNQRGFQKLDFTNTDEVVEKFFDSIITMKRVGYDLLLGRIFFDIGFNKVQDEYFRELVLARVAFPKSKLKTTEFLYRYKQIDWDEDQLYRYLDKLHNTQKELVQQISYQHTLQILNNTISIVFTSTTVANPAGTSFCASFYFISPSSTGSTANLQ